MWSIFVAFCVTLGSLAKADVLAKAIVEERSVDETQVFTVSNSSEYFIKFKVPDHLKEKYNAHPEKHIFQVKSFIQFYVSHNLTCEG